MGFEYRSECMLWGLPLVHITRGMDPVTGRPRLAQGIIAIGDRARGVIAFGGLAVGVVTFGGLSVGLLSFGGCALGVLGAVGGLAVALGCAVGGAAVGSIALGGGAIGYLAYGGGAWGVHAFGGNASDPLARQFFEPWAKNLMDTSLSWQWPILAFLLGVGIGVPAWVEARMRPVDDPRRRSLKWAVLGWMVLIPVFVILSPRLIQRPVPARGGIRTTTLFEIHQGTGVVASDLDTGEGKYRPSNWSDMSESQRAHWAQGVGADLMLDDIGEPWNLLTPSAQGITAVRVDNRLWNRMSVRDLTRALSEPKIQMTVQQDGQWRRYALTDHGHRSVGLNCPVTLVIRTARDNVVLVRITSCVLEPRAITFNYKLLRTLPGLAGLLQRPEGLDVESDVAAVRALSIRIQAAIADVNMVSYQSDIPAAKAKIEDVLALEARLMAAMADTEAEPLWRTVMDQARELRHAIEQGQPDLATRVMASLKVTLDQALWECVNLGSSSY
jgi:hypothetical protein